MASIPKASQTGVTEHAPVQMYPAHRVASRTEISRPQNIELGERRLHEAQGHITRALRSGQIHLQQ